MLVFLGISFLLLAAGASWCAFEYAKLSKLEQASLAQWKLAFSPRLTLMSAITQNKPIELAVNAIESDGTKKPLAASTLTWTVNGAPAGSAVSPAATEGFYNFTPTELGTVTLAVTDGTFSASQEFTVEPAPVVETGIELTVVPPTV